MQTIQELLARDEGSTSDSSTAVQYISTVEAYDKWAEVYDTDGNFLQRLDTIEISRILPRFVECVYDRFRHQLSQSERMIFLDLGCGTGRNTIQLMRTLGARGSQDSLTRIDHSSGPEAQVIGLDASPGMLEVAKSNIKKVTVEDTTLRDIPAVILETVDLLQPATVPKHLPPALQEVGAAGVISTLVLEHVPLKDFFKATSATMRPGGYLLITNMHADMGLRSQAGFTDPKTGVKIRPTSYCHSIDDVLTAAAVAGFQVEKMFDWDPLNGVLERSVDGNLVDRLGMRAKKWLGTTVWFGVCFSKRTSER